MKLTEIVWVVAASLLCVGCGTTRNCSGPAAGANLSAPGAGGAATLPVTATRQYELRMDDFAESMLQRARVKPPDRSYQVLVLSGGRSNGPWGAGFLSGWGQSGKRPQFDVVTGISTGALISTGAFLGDDELLRKAFTTVHTSDIAINRFILSIPFSD